MQTNQAIHLRSITVRKLRPWPDSYPHSVPVLRSLSILDFGSPVTFFVGENGCGKSTLLEAIACAAGSITVGSDSVQADATLAPLRALAKDLRLSWSKRTHLGFFMRSEDFFGFARKMESTRDELQRNLDDVEVEYRDSSETARHYARAAYRRELGAIGRYYGEGVDSHSHGESYLALFRARFVPDGLYLLDEPEAPLSPQRQLSFLYLLKTMVDQNAQFLISTHSPILMAYPHATILRFEGDRIEAVDYEDLEHVRVTRDFLTHRDRYLKHLLE